MPEQRSEVAGLVDRHLEAMLDDAIEAVEKSKTNEDRQAANKEFELVVSMLKLRHA